jgi:membrane associated rhomboid family serine protease
MIALLLIIANVFVSYKGFKDHAFFDRYKFNVGSIRLYKDYKRMVTSDFLHVGWTHLLFNMLSLFIFSSSVEAYLGSTNFLLIYVASMVGCNLLTLLIHWRDGDYSSVGASGAVSGVIFAAIALFPGMRMGFFLLPLSIPAWIFGVLYVAFSIWGIKSKRDNIGHEAHLGGALVGMAMAVLIHPAAFAQNYLVILLITVPAIVFLYLIVTRPHILLIDNYYFKTHNNHYSPDHKYNEERTNRQQEIDRLLDKISKRGINSLTAKEKEILKRHSRGVR